MRALLSLIVHRVRHPSTRGNDGNNKHAKVHNIIVAATDGIPVKKFVWMPAHKCKHYIGVNIKRNCIPLTQREWRGYELASVHAKLVVVEHRVPEAVRDIVRNMAKQTEQCMTWIGQVTTHTNNREE